MDTTNDIGSKPVLELTEKKLEDIAYYAEAQLKLKQIAMIIGVPEHDFINAYKDENSAIYRAVKKGRYLCIAGVQKSIIDSAKQSSHPAQQMALRLINRNEKLDEDELD